LCNVHYIHYECYTNVDTPYQEDITQLYVHHQNKTVSVDNTQTDNNLLLLYRVKYVALCSYVTTCQAKISFE